METYHFAWQIDDDTNEIICGGLRTRPRIEPQVSIHMIDALFRAEPSVGCNIRLILTAWSRIEQLLPGDYIILPIVESTLCHPEAYALKQISVRMTMLEFCQSKESSAVYLYLYDKLLCDWVNVYCAILIVVYFAGTKNFIVWTTAVILTIYVIDTFVLTRDRLQSFLVGEYSN